MSRLHVKYLLLGGGISSWSAAHAIRQCDPAGSVLMVGLETVRPYHRSMLRSYVSGDAGDREALFAAPPEWFADNHVELRSGCRAVRLDVPRMAAALDNGETVSCERMLIATGAAPRRLDIPGTHLPNVFYLQTLADAERLRHALEPARSDHRTGATRIRQRPRAVVIGGGMRGIEIAGSLAASEVEAHLVEAAPHLCSRFAGDVLARSIELAISQRNVRVHCNAEPVRIDGDGRVQKVTLSDGTTLPCELVVIAAGSIVPRQLLRGTAIACERAILVDRFCQSNVPGIFAAGDCSAVLDPLFGKHRWIDTQDHALFTGRIAGTNMSAGDAAPPPAAYAGANHFSTDVFGLHLDGWGEARFVKRRILRGSIAADSVDLIELGFDDKGGVAQVLALNHPADAEMLERAVDERLDSTGIEDRLRDPHIAIDRWFDNE